MAHYIIVEDAVYRHDIFGGFTDLETAKEFATQIVTGELFTPDDKQPGGFLLPSDGHHQYPIYRLPDIPGKVKRTMGTVARVPRTFRYPAGDPIVAGWWEGDLSTSEPQTSLLGGWHAGCAECGTEPHVGGEGRCECDCHWTGGD